MVSTLVLSAVVISAVGWYLLRQTRDGLLDHRVDTVVAEAAGETREAEVELTAASGTEVDAARPAAATLAGPIIERGETRGYSVVVAGPVDAGRRSRTGARVQPGLDLARSVPALAAGAARLGRRDHRPGPTPRS